MLLRGRYEIFAVWHQLVADFSWFDWLFGRGFGRFAEEYVSASTYWVYDRKTAELDPIDLLFSNGIVGLVAVFSFYVSRTRRAWRRLRDGTDLRLSIAMFWVHSLFAGHAMSSPIVGTNIAGVLALGRAERPPPSAGQTAPMSG